jgi:cytidine deaminase
VKLDQRLVDAAVELMNRRFTSHELAGAAAMYTREGALLTSTFKYKKNDHATLCYETGAICEAHKLGHTPSAIVCVARGIDSDRVVIFTPCGICQERLYFWGSDIEVGVPDPSDPTRWVARRLDEVQPYHWAKVLQDED